jgi:hypothetical protein
MKKIILTLAEFLLLVKVHKSEVLHEEVEVFIEQNASLCEPGILAGEVEMILTKVSFEDTIFAVEDYQEKIGENEDEFQAVESLLKKLQVVKAEEE